MPLPPFHLYFLAPVCSLFLNPSVNQMSKCFLLAIGLCRSLSFSYWEDGCYTSCESGSPGSQWNPSDLRFPGSLPFRCLTHCPFFMSYALFRKDPIAKRAPLAPVGVDFNASLAPLSISYLTFSWAASASFVYIHFTSNQDPI